MATISFRIASSSWTKCTRKKPPHLGDRLAEGKQQHGVEVGNGVDIDVSVENGVDVLLGGSDADVDEALKGRESVSAIISRPFSDIAKLPA